MYKFNDTRQQEKDLWQFKTENKNLFLKVFLFNWFPSCKCLYC